MCVRTSFYNVSYIRAINYIVINGFKYCFTFFCHIPQSYCGEYIQLQYFFHSSHILSSRTAVITSTYSTLCSHSSALRSSIIAVRTFTSSTLCSHSSVILSSSIVVSTFTYSILLFSFISHALPFFLLLTSSIHCDSGLPPPLTYSVFISKSLYSVCKNIVSHIFMFFRSCL